MQRQKYLLTVTFTPPDRSKPIDNPMDAFTAAMCHAFPDRQHIHAVTALSYANSRDRHITQVLESLPADSEILIQPCFVTAGSEFDRLRRLLPNRPKLALGRPLLSDESNARACAQAILPTLHAHCTVFMVHGSKAPGATDYAHLMEQAFVDLGRRDVYFANMEGSNGLTQLLPRLQVKTVELRPFLFYPRLHKLQDLDQRWKTALEQAGHEVQCRTPGLCVYPEVQQLYISHAREAISTWK